MLVGVGNISSCNCWPSVLAGTLLLQPQLQMSTWLHCLRHWGDMATSALGGGFIIMQIHVFSQFLSIVMLC